MDECHTLPPRLNADPECWHRPSPVEPSSNGVPSRYARPPSCIRRPITPNLTTAYMTQSIMPQHANTYHITFGGQVRENPCHVTFSILRNLSTQTFANLLSSPSSWRSWPGWNNVHTFLRQGCVLHTFWQQVEVTWLKILVVCSLHFLQCQGQTSHSSHVHISAALTLFTAAFLLQDLTVSLFQIAQKSGTCYTLLLRCGNLFLHQAAKHV
jgi:hypothetical protein